MDQGLKVWLFQLFHQLGVKYSNGKKFPKVGLLLKLLLKFVTLMEFIKEHRKKKTDFAVSINYTEPKKNWQNIKFMTRISKVRNGSWRNLSKYLGGFERWIRSVFKIGRIEFIFCLCKWHTDHDAHKPIWREGLLHSPFFRLVVFWSEAQKQMKMDHDEIYQDTWEGSKDE